MSKNKEIYYALYSDYSDEFITPLCGSIDDLNSRMLREDITLESIKVCKVEVLDDYTVDLHIKKNTLMNFLVKYLFSNEPKEFSIKPWYCEEDDSLQVFFEDCSSYKEYLNEYIDLYRSVEHPEKIVGVKINKVSSLIK